ncbi:TIGR02679 family protein [Egicoccus halophilus]|uniref:TIGR02679 family protein n=1 Tax=Egicoccus halophilus TaxID=1670830 RepID=A0A8J3EW26_9ACTN|nr:TIGR02679 family protein [Egicoccus halophilus]GGI09397.1 hypothetical protein GCM10011354_33870 [Egicoccus halophilus]
MTVDRGRAVALFGEELTWIVDRLQARLERGQPLHGRLRLAHPTDAQREAVERLTGRRPTTAGSVSVEVADLERILAHAGIAPDLRSLVETLRGPVLDRPAAAAAEQRRWRLVHDRLRTDAEDVDPTLVAWADELATTGLLRRLAGDAEVAAQLGDQALEVLRRLPADAVPLPQLAATSLGDSHALDDGTSLSTLVLRGIESVTGLPRRDRRAAERRALWARVGVLLDELSAPVLVAGLRPSGDGLLATTLREHADAGEPCRITLRLLVRHPADWTSLRRQRVLVCENPTVAAAVTDRCGPATPPLVCTDGQPSGSVQTLLGQLVDAGVVLDFHADFDGGGVRIGNLLIDRFGATPWRMGRTAYEEAATSASRPLGAVPPEASWDPELSAAIIARGRAVHEEQLLDELVTELMRDRWITPG